MGKRKDGTKVSTVTSVAFGEGYYVLRRETTEDETTFFVHHPDGEKIEFSPTGNDLDSTIREFHSLPGVKEAYDYQEAKHAQSVAAIAARWAALREEKARRAAMTHCPHCKEKL